MKKLIVLAASRLFGGKSPMKITRRFAVATLFVIAVAIFLGVPAPASAINPRRTQVERVKLYPAADSPLPHATGTLTASWSVGGFGYDAVGVSVSRLAPNASYYMPVTVVDPWRGTIGVWNVPIQTDARGNGKGGWSGYNRGYYYGNYYDYHTTTVIFQLYDSSGTLVLTSNP